MGGIFSGPSSPPPAPPPAPPPPPAPAPAPAAPEPVKATTEENKLASNTRARRRMGTRLLFNADRSAGLGQNQMTLGGDAGPGQNTLA